MKCPAEGCDKEYPAEEMSEHQLTCAGRKNISCLDSECVSSELWTKEAFVTHLLEKSHLETYAGIQKLFQVKPWWFVSGTSKITFIMKSQNNIWVGVGTSDNIDGEDVRVFILYHISNVDPTIPPKESFATRFVTNLTARGKDGRIMTAWTGTSPSIYEKQDKILADKQCFVLNIDPKKIFFIGVNIIEQRVGRSLPSPELQWQPYSRP